MSGWIFVRETGGYSTITPTSTTIPSHTIASATPTATPLPSDTPTVTITPTFTPTLTATPIPTQSLKVVSKWEINFDWGCTGATSSGVISFWEDGTLTTDELENGHWSIADNQWEIIVSHRVRYVGELNEEQSIENGEIYTINSENSELKTGCFTARQLKK